MVYVLNKDGQPLMPTDRHGKVKHLLRQGKAKVVTVKPFTIQLLYEVRNYTQDVTLGIDSGYLNIGFSAVTETKEFISGEVKLLQDMKERLYDRSTYRKLRRQRLRHRRKKRNLDVPKGWFAPSIRHKLTSHIRFIGKMKRILPITKIVIEVANFDIQKIKNPYIQGEEYQQGEQLGFFNVREYVLHRDNHDCQNPACKNQDKNKVLEVHHILFRENGGSDAPNNLITLCTRCHTPENHKGFLKDWKPKLNSFKDATYMSMVRWKLIDRLREVYDKVECTYGYITKNSRINQNLEKTHYNDAFCIAGGNKQTRANSDVYEQVRRNNRSLEKFYDAKYVDNRTGETVPASNLNTGRRTRNKNKNGENLKRYRGQKISKGRRSIRRKRHFYQPNDLVRYNGKIYAVAGSQNEGKYVKLKGLKKVPSVKLLTPYRFCKGFVCNIQTETIPTII